MEDAELRISFTMSGEDYAAARGFKKKTITRKMGLGPRLFQWGAAAAVLALLIGFCIYTKDLFFLFPIVTALVGGGLFYKFSGKLMGQSLHFADRTLSGMHTVLLRASEIELISGYQKLRVPLRNLFAVGETKRHILLLFDAGLDAVAINKAAVEQTLLMPFLNKLREGMARGKIDGTAS